LLAIHNSHYAIEQILREQARNVTFDAALHKIGFEEIITKLRKQKNIPEFNRLLEFNKIRNNAEHFNIIPDVDTVRFYIRIVEDFLKWSYRTYFKTDYGSLALEEMIHDAPIKKVLLEAKESVNKNDLHNASQKMYEALGAFKFMMFGYFSDYRVAEIGFSGIDFPNLLADLAFKIMFSEDEVALRKLLSIRSSFKQVNGNWVPESVYPIPPFKDSEEAKEHYEDILNIILTYQDKIPASFWRTE